MSDPNDLLPVGTPIDLDNCAREPIHIPGSIQPRGALIAAREPDLVITQVSANSAALLGVEPGAALGQPLAAVIGEPAAATVQRAAAVFGDLRERNPLDAVIPIDGQDVAFDAILHRPGGGVLVIELEPAEGPRPFSFPNTYLAVRGAVNELNRAATLDELYRITAEAVRTLTGFDRVMVYRYDDEYNGEVVAEAKRDDLNPFLGLHYPASDIPAQARALYEKNWLRLISDVDYQPAPLVPALDPVSGAPLDLTYSTLRSVSPIHVEYLQNMGVGASMSISLLRDGRLWGLIACHHYSGPHTPPYGVRAAAEFLGSTLSLRLIDREEDDALRRQLRSQSELAELTAATLDESRPVADAMLGAGAGDADLLGFLDADGVAVIAEGRLATRGVVPGDDAIRSIAAWSAEKDDELYATDSLRNEATGLDVPESASGILALHLPDRQAVVWFRGEVRRTVDWGGDPHNKAIAVQEGDSVRLSPRKSFERWREEIQNRSEPWTRYERELGTDLRRHLVEALYIRSQRDLRTAEILQRSLLPNRLPTVDGWELSAHYERAVGGRIGGDWYEAFPRRDGILAVAVGDVAGHGVGTAGTMAQLRNALRAYLLEGADPPRALDQLNEFAAWLLPDAYATAVVACVDTRTGTVTTSSAGHLTPYLRRADGTVGPAPVSVAPPLGIKVNQPPASSFVMEPGDVLILFSDGLVERRTEDLDVGFARLHEYLATASAPTAREAFSSVADPGGLDDATALVVRRAS
jgi:light-regulated signal transduction histidine kinase (bacteriophytochrome)